MMRANRRPNEAGDDTAMLTARQQRTCALAWIERRTRSQIGAAHGISPSAAKKRIQRARQRIRAAGVDPPARPPAFHRTPAFQLGPIENV